MKKNQKPAKFFQMPWLYAALSATRAIACAMDGKSLQMKHHHHAAKKAACIANFRLRHYWTSMTAETPGITKSSCPSAAPATPRHGLHIDTATVAPLARRLRQRLIRIDIHACLGSRDGSPLPPPRVPPVFRTH
ncbi:MAG TPA: hypothetical protein VK325_05035 [Pseudoxanthomonas sp.]|nr:hypothetical protein [Pseudoxanthomonas sp.]